MSFLIYSEEFGVEVYFIRYKKWLHQLISWIYLLRNHFLFFYPEVMSIFPVTIYCLNEAGGRSNFCIQSFSLCEFFVFVFFLVGEFRTSLLGDINKQCFLIPITLFLECEFSSSFDFYSQIICSLCFLGCDLPLQDDSFFLVSSGWMDLKIDVALLWFLSWNVFLSPSTVIESFAEYNSLC